MRSWVLAIVGAALVCSACGGGLMKKQYEYEEELYLALDGSATLNVNASVPALVALRGVDLNPSPRARFNRDRIRRFYEGPGVTVTALSSSRRHGRRFVHVSIEVARSFARSSGLAPFAWSTYRFAREGDVYEFKQLVGAAGGESPSSGVGWDGTELVAFRMHLPSRITYHNAPSHRTERGNILEWEQTLADRLQGRRLTSMCRWKLSRFSHARCCCLAPTVVAALVTLAAVIWWIARRGHAASSRGQEAPGPLPAVQLEMLEILFDFGVGLQIVRHREGAERAGDRPREHPIGIAVDYTVKCDMAVLDDDVDRRVGHRPVVPEVRVAVNGSRDPEPQFIVKAATPAAP